MKQTIVLKNCQLLSIQLKELDCISNTSTSVLLYNGTQLQSDYKIYRPEVSSKMLFQVVRGCLNQRHIQNTEALELLISLYSNSCPYELDTTERLDPIMRFVRWLRWWSGTTKRPDPGCKKREPD